MANVLQGKNNMKVKYTTIIVQDMEKSIEFYSEVMGFEIDSQHKPVPEMVITLMKSKGDTMVELIKQQTIKARKDHHCMACEFVFNDGNFTNNNFPCIWDTKTT